MHTWGVVGYQAVGDADPIKAFHVRAAEPGDAVAIVKRSSEALGLGEVLAYARLRVDTPGRMEILFAGPAPVGLGRPKDK